MNFIRHVCMGTLIGCVVPAAVRRPGSKRHTIRCLKNGADSHVKQQADLQVALARSLEKSAPATRPRRPTRKPSRSDLQRPTASIALPS